MRKTIVLSLVAGASLWALDAVGAQWKQLAKSPIGELWFDAASVKRNGGDVAFDYRIDYPKPQPVVDSKAEYRSTVTRVIVRCAAHTIATGPTIAYAGARAGGKEVGRFPPSPEEARFQPIDRNSSDENLWQQVCQVARVTPQK
jgi:hypothetical protein